MNLGWGRASQLGRQLGKGALLWSALLLSSPVAGSPPAERTIPLQDAPGNGTSLTRLGQAIAKLPVDSETVVVVASPRLEEPHGRIQISKDQLEALRLEIQKAVAPLVPRAKFQESAALSPELARSLARTRDLSLTYIEPRISSGKLELLVTQRSWPASFWLRALDPAGTIVHQVRVAADADAQVRTLFPAARKLLEKVRKHKSPIFSPLALACGDLGRGSQEIIVLGRRAVAVGAFRDSGFVVREQRSLSEISAIAGAPLRAPLGSLVITPRGVRLGTSDREDLVLLDGSLKVVGRTKRLFPIDEQRCAPFSTEGILARFEDCPSPTEKAPSAVSELLVGESWDGVTRSSLTQASGVAKEYLVELPAASSEAKLSIESTLSRTEVRSLDEIGAAFTLGDVNGDGQMDLVASSATRAGTEDTLRILSSLDQAPEPIARRSMERISALTLCPFRGTNPLALVVASGSDLYLFE